MKVLLIQYNMGALGTLMSVFDMVVGKVIYSRQIDLDNSAEIINDICREYYIGEIKIIGPKEITKHFFQKPIIAYEKEVPIEFLER